MSDLQTPIRTNTWIVAPWDDYSRTQADPRFENAKGYYYKGHMRLDLSPVSFDHGSDHVAIIF